jgi:Rod binding domain-containing protein
MKAKDSKTTQKLGEDFESYFLTSMLKELDKTTHLSKKSYKDETYSSIMYEKLGEYLAKKGVGIKDMLMKYMERAESSKVFEETGDNKDK